MEAEREALVCCDCGETGGRFILKSNGEWVHSSCRGGTKGRDAAKNLWDFTTSHLDPNHPVHVTSARQLAALEREYGVVNRSLHYDETNW